MSTNGATTPRRWGRDDRASSARTGLPSDKSHRRQAFHCRPRRRWPRPERPNRLKHGLIVHRRRSAQDCSRRNPPGNRRRKQRPQRGKHGGEFHGTVPCLEATSSCLMMFLSFRSRRLDRVIAASDFVGARTVLSTRETSPSSSRACPVRREEDFPGRAAIDPINARLRSIEIEQSPGNQPEHWSGTRQSSMSIAEPANSKLQEYSPANQRLGLVARQARTSRVTRRGTTRRRGPGRAVSTTCGSRPSSSSACLRKGFASFGQELGVGKRPQVVRPHGPAPASSVSITSSKMVVKTRLTNKRAKTSSPTRR